MDSAVSSSPFLRSVIEAIRVRHYSIRTELLDTKCTRLILYFLAITSIYSSYSGRSLSSGLASSYIFRNFTDNSSN